MRSFFVAFLFTVAAVLGTVALFNYVVDPLQFFRVYPWGRPFFFKDERFQNPGLARHYPYDTIIMGNSLSENFRPSFIWRAAGWRTVNLAISGAYAYEQHKMLDVALSSGRTKRVIWGVAWDAFARPSGERADLGGLPLYFYESRPYALITNYLLSISTLNRSLQGLSGRASRDLDTLNNFSAERSYGCGAIRFHYSSAYELRKFAGALASRQLILDAPHLSRSLEDHLFAPIRQHPEIAFDLYLPPTSIWFRRWTAEYFPATLQSFYDFRRLLIEGSRRHDNIRLFDYQSDPVVLEPKWYSDLSHYSGAINDRIILDMQKGRAPVPLSQEALQRQLTMPDECHTGGSER
jgi:hypothetical protein